MISSSSALRAGKRNAFKDDRYLSHGSFEQVGSNLFGNLHAGGSNEALFGSSISLSSDGLRLAIGAVGHDANSSSIGTGAVYCYNFEPYTRSWELTFMMEGEPGEHIGSFVALSGDGSRVAIRRFPDDSPNFVDVYDATSGSRIGTTPLACDSVKGSTVAISHDGNRVAVSCERSGVNQGKVEIFEWNGIEWSPMVGIDGSAIGISNQGLFGWSSSFSNSGNRLAVSAPLFTSNGIIRRGVVKVFEYNDASRLWQQIGNDLLGKAAMEKFGLAIDLSENGSTLFVGSPRLRAGIVEIFELNSGLWIAKGNAVEGEKEHDSFGICVSSSFDGNTFVASSANHNDGRGQVRMMKFDGSDWNEVDYVEGLDAGDSFGASGRHAVSSSADGSRFAAGSKLGMNEDGIATGRVRVFGYYVTPSLAPPEAAPSHSPSISILPSSNPSFLQHSTTEQISNFSKGNNDSTAGLIVMGAGIAGIAIAIAAVVFWRKRRQKHEQKESLDGTFTA
eukprot:CAMPEP_0178932654 /NCGR_PEP_ID=MMETSP0786-20121207/22758_1 /TAXON_ID=186022 /ORGANISM="Thalassionema frauenfeldii, Strain CCMP 1798" /LENGTH=503 /DNA_ID=CAMNT_0020610011 /DNA_START=382 /DNA_END=1893 /DNA_ORIENTATION=+